MTEALQIVTLTARRLANLNHPTCHRSSIRLNEKFAASQIGRLFFMSLKPPMIDAQNVKKRPLLSKIVKHALP
jgi:hypothetical protein